MRAHPLVLVGLVLASFSIACGHNGVCERRQQVTPEAGATYECVQGSSIAESDCQDTSVSTELWVTTGQTCQDLGYDVEQSVGEPGVYEEWWASADASEPGANGNWKDEAGGGGGPDGGTLNALDGIWVDGDAQFEGVGDQLNFYVVPFSSSNNSWYDALQKGFIAIGDPLVRNIVQDGTGGYVGEVLWRSGNTTDGVTAVNWSPGSTLFLDSTGTQLSITSTSPDDGSSGTVVLTRQ